MGRNRYPGAKTVKDISCFTSDSKQRKATRSGELKGLTFALKDLCDVKGHTTSFGHPQWRKTHQPAEEDSFVLAKILDSGANLEGTTKMDQLAFSLIGNVGEGEAPKNSTYPERFCGGSSSGSASAVAGGLVDFAVGSDTAGSVRVPASVCGIYGIRTTHGLIDKSGVVPLAESFDVLGFFAREAKTLERVVQVFASDQQVHTFSRILVPTNMEEVTTEKYAKAIRKEAERLAVVHNLTVEEIDLSEYVSEEAASVLRNNQSREIGKTHAEWAKANKQHLDDDVRKRLEFCLNIATDDEDTVKKDMKKRARYTERIEKLIGSNSVLCLPVAPESGPNLEWSDDKLAEFRGRVFRLSAPASISGLPQLSAPIAGSTTNIGLMGPKNSDLALTKLV